MKERTGAGVTPRRWRKVGYASAVVGVSIGVSLACGGEDATCNFASSKVRQCREEIEAAYDELGPRVGYSTSYSIECEGPRLCTSECLLGRSCEHLAAFFATGCERPNNPNFMPMYDQEVLDLCQCFSGCFAQYRYEP